MSYEDILIQESTGEGYGWPLDRTEATADWYDNVLDETVGSTGDGDVCFPALSPVPLQTFNAGESVVGTDSDTLVRGERQPASATVGSNPTALRPLQLDWPAWRLSFSAYGEHMGWEVPA